MTANRRRQRPPGNAEMEIRAAQRRRAPSYTVVKDWVPARVNAMAGKLYHFYRMHLNRERADGLVWPTMETAAVYLGLSRGDKVTPYMDELENAGAIHATREGQEDGRYLVLVYEDPPDDFDGPVTLAEWYQANRAELDRRRDAAKIRRAARKAAKAGLPADTPNTGDPPDTPQTGYPDTPSTGGADTPSTGREPLGTEPLGTEPFTSSPDPALAVISPLASNKAEAEEDESQKDLRAVAQAVLDSVELSAFTTPGSRVRGAKRVHLEKMIAERLAAGWSKVDAEDALSGPLDNVHSVYAVLRSRIADLMTGDPPPARQPRSAPTDDMVRCPKCAPYRPGWIDSDPDHIGRCSACFYSPRRGFIPTNQLVTA